MAEFSPLTESERGELAECLSKPMLDRVLHMQDKLLAALDALTIIAGSSKDKTAPQLSSEDSWGNYDDVFYDGMRQADYAAASVARRVVS